MLAELKLLPKKLPLYFPRCCGALTGRIESVAQLAGSQVANTQYYAFRGNFTAKTSYCNQN